MQEVLEQQHQHDVDTEDAGEHGQAKAGKQFTHHLGVTQCQLFHARRQGLNGRQLVHRLGHITQRGAGQFDLEGDVAGPVEPVNHRRAASQLQGGDLAEHHRAP